MDYKGIGKRIRSHRLKSNLTLETLAEKVELSPNYMGKIERGEKKFSFEAIVRISSCLNTTIDDLIYNTIKDDHRNNLESLLNRCSNRQICFIIDFVKIMIRHTSV